MCQALCFMYLIPNPHNNPQGIVQRKKSRFGEGHLLTQGHTTRSSGVAVLHPQSEPKCQKAMAASWEGPGRPSQWEAHTRDLTYIAQHQQLVTHISSCQVRTVDCMQLVWSLPSRGCRDLEIRVQVWCQRVSFKTGREAVGKD